MNPRRSRPARPPRRAILIVCEGAQTEPCYFKALVRRLGLAATVEVEIRGDTGYTDPAGLVEEALRLKKQRASAARNSNVLADSAPGFHIPSAVGTAVHRLVQALVDMSSDEAGKRTLGIIAASSS